LAIVALASVGCGNDSFTNPDAPTPTQVTETFGGSVRVSGAVTEPFAVQTTGSVIATLTALEPEDAVIGLSIGTWNGIACSVGAPTLANDNAKVGVTLTGSATVTGNYCVRVYDAGTLTQTTSYQLTVTHF
jgi:hypothetical protein